MQLFGLSINLITLFALVLAIGIVVDNAIVVVEAVHAKMEENPRITPYQAVKEVLGEISGAIIAITASNGFGIYSHFIYVWTCWYFLSTIFDYHGKFNCYFCNCST